MIIWWNFWQWFVRPSTFTCCSQSWCSRRWFILLSPMNIIIIIRSFLWWRFWLFNINKAWKWEIYEYQVFHYYTKQTTEFLTTTFAFCDLTSLTLLFFDDEDWSDDPTLFALELIPFLNFDDCWLEDFWFKAGFKDWGWFVRRCIFVFSGITGGGVVERWVDGPSIEHWIFLGCRSIIICVEFS